MLVAVLTLVIAADPGPLVGQTRWRGPELDAAQLALYEQQFRAALRRYGLPVDSVEGTESRVGAAATAECAEQSARCTLAKGAYRAMLLGELRPVGGGFRAHYEIVSTESGVVITSEEIEAPDPRTFLDAQVGLAQRMAGKTASELGVHVPVDAPLRGAAIYPLVAGTVLVGTGTYFLVSASSASNTLKNPMTPLDEANGARTSGSRDLILGLTLTGLGVAGLVLGVVFYAPGAENKPLVQLSVDPVGQRIALTGALP